MDQVMIAMQGVGWLGMLLILYGVNQKSRLRRQAIMATGATLLAIMAGYPEIKPVFFYLQCAVGTVGYINIRPHTERFTLPVIFLGAALSAFHAFQQSLGLDTWLAIAGLIGIALGYAGTPESDGGRQNLWFGIGGTGMVGYSVFGVLAGVWQAWPFLILNIPFGYWGFRNHYILRKELGHHKNPGNKID
ncbi:MAG: hypothetical protein OEY44_03355 [Candidatus Peregrinibacteria bacterium]|nr:hypothetical protein [Candidatus Peregrinibacteria bacterium]